MEKINFKNLSDEIQEGRHNSQIQTINDHCLRIAVNEDSVFEWHSHPDSDEMFLVTEGNLVIEFKEAPSVSLLPGECFTVTKGTVHRTIARGRTVNLCFESTEAKTLFLETQV